MIDNAILVFSNFHVESVNGSQNLTLWQLLPMNAWVQHEICYVYNNSKQITSKENYVIGYLVAESIILIF